MSRLVSSLSNVVQSAVQMAQDPKWTLLAGRVLWLFDALLSTAILFKINCLSLLPFCLTSTDTEIDWKAYMEQIEQYLAGERDYALIKGGTGPLWFIHMSITIDISYPAGHVWIYTALYKITSNGKDVFSAQVVFVLLYLATLGITISMYRAARVNQRRGVSKIRSLRISFHYSVCQNDYTAYTSSDFSTIAGHNYFLSRLVGCLQDDNGLPAASPTPSHWESK